MRKLISQMYANTPLFLQNILTSWKGYCTMRSRYGSIYYSLLLELEEQQYLNEHHAKKYQEQELQRLLYYAMEKSPFYREFYKNLNIEKVKTIDDMKALPILDKEVMQKNIQTIYTVAENTAAESEMIDIKESELKLLFTKEDVQRNNAFLDFFKKQHGAVNLDMKRASFSSKCIIPDNQQNKVFWRENYFVRQRIYSSDYCNQENAAVYLEDLEKYKPDFIDGLPSAIYELAKYINRNRILFTAKPIAIFSAGEIVRDYQKKEIEEAFNCPVRDRYSPSKASPLVMECVKGKMHYNLYSGLIEITEEGNMIVTSFNSYGTPLIRYDIGDRVELPEVKAVCECGSIYPVFEKIHEMHPGKPSIVKRRNLSMDYYSETLG